MVKHHAIFQGYNFFHYIGMDRNLREEFRENPNFERTEAFIACYDDPAFDAGRPVLSLETFAPLVRQVFSKPKHSLYQRML